MRRNGWAQPAVERHASQRDALCAEWLGAAATAERGYALDNEESSIGVRCVASPVVDVGGNIRASIGVSGPATRLDEETIGKCAVLVCAAAKSLSELLGGEWDFPLPCPDPAVLE